MEKYEEPVFTKYMSVADLTRSSIPGHHGSNVSEGTNATYNVMDCFDAKNIDAALELEEGYCVTEST